MALITVPATPTPQQAAADAIKLAVYDALERMAHAQKIINTTFWQGAVYTPAQVAAIFGTDGGKFVSTSTAIVNFVTNQCTLHGVPLATFLQSTDYGIPAGHTLVVNGDQSITVT